MILPTRTLVFWLACLLVGCAKSPHPRIEGTDAPGVHAMYVPESELGARSKHDGVEVLTSILLRHITASAAEQHLRGRLPEGVRMGRPGQVNSILLQGPGPRVYDAVETLKKFDVSKEPGK